MQGHIAFAKRIQSEGPDHLFVQTLVHLGSVSGSVLQVDVRSAAVGGRRGDPRRQGARSGAGALRNLWQNMWRNGGEGEPPADGTPAFQQVTPPNPLRNMQSLLGCLRHALSVCLL